MLEPAAVLAAATGRLGRLLLALPEPLLDRLGGAPPAAAPDLSPEARALARATRLVPAAESAPAQGADLARERALFDAQTAAVGGRPSFPGEVRDLVVDGAVGPLRARLYAPSDVPVPAPLLVFWHGGGWVKGSVVSHDAPCRELARRAGVRVLSVEYRLAPEHPWPAAADDALAAWRWVRAHLDELGAHPGRVAVGGDSAGGNLAAVLCQDARRLALPAPSAQLLVYPGVDMTRKRPSVHSFASGYLLSEADIDRYKAAYAPDRSTWTDPRVSPLLEPDLAGLPRAVVLTASADPLRDEGEDYAALLRQAGVEVELHRVPHLHGFLNLTSGQAATRGLALAAMGLRDALAG